MAWYAYSGTSYLSAEDRNPAQDRVWFLLQKITKHNKFYVVLEAGTVVVFPDGGAWNADDVLFLALGAGCTDTFTLKNKMCCAVHLFACFSICMLCSKSLLSKD